MYNDEEEFLQSDNSDSTVKRKRIKKKYFKVIKDARNIEANQENKDQKTNQNEF